MKPNLLAPVLGGAIGVCALAQVALAMEPEEIVVTSTRLEQTTMRSPVAVTTVGAEDIREARQQLGLDESLSRVPGVFFQNRYNFAQDLRISIRGFGARSAFGIRGIKLFVDGFPATTPDGQGGIDDIDLGSTERVEVIRGPASALYGSAAGGVISLYTEDGPAQPYISARASFGEYASQKHQLKAAGTTGKLGYLASVTDIDVEGYRGHSRNESTLFNSKFTYDLDESMRLTAVLSGVDSPLAQDAGALNAGEVEADRAQGRARNIQFDAGESVEQQRLGLALSKVFDQNHQLVVRAYGLGRDFATRLPFEGSIEESNGGQVAFDRRFVGLSAQYAYEGTLFGRAHRWITGIDVDSQEDDRQRWVNNDGLRGELTFDQVETVESIGVFAQSEFALSDRLLLTLGARYDSIEYEVDDRFTLNASGEDSGAVQFEELTPMMGLVYSPSESVNVYANVSTSFETPTTTEFANPDGGGFNQGLQPQEATNYEIGLKGEHNNRLRYEVALFSIDVSDELIPFEQDGRTFFENAGDSTRKGLELALLGSITDTLTATLSYTYSDFTFDRFRTRDGDVFDNNALPGLPENQLFVELAYRHPSGFFATWDLLNVGEFFADNANSDGAKISRSSVANLRLGADFNLGQLKLSPFLGVNNLFDELYFTNVRLNGGFSRYFEPAPETNVYGGLTLRHEFGRAR